MVRPCVLSTLLKNAWYETPCKVVGRVSFIKPLQKVLLMFECNNEANLHKYNTKFILGYNYWMNFHNILYRYPCFS